MFVVEVVTLLATALFIRDLAAGDAGFSFQIIVWLWFTILFANFAEAVAEGRQSASGNFASGGFSMLIRRINARWSDSHQLDLAARLTPQNDQLMSECCILCFKPALRFEWQGQDGQG